MTHTDRLVILGVAFLVAYVGVLIWNGPVNTKEAFPAFNWSLFSEMPEPQLTDYSIRLTEVDGQKLPEPLYYDEAKGYISTPFRPEPYLVMQQMGHAIVADQPERFSSAREVLESRWMENLDSAEYEIVQRKFDIIERVGCDCFTEETVLREVSIER